VSEYVIILCSEREENELEERAKLERVWLEKQKEIKSDFTHFYHLTSNLLNSVKINEKFMMDV